MARIFNSMSDKDIFYAMERICPYAFYIFNIQNKEYIYYSTELEKLVAPPTSNTDIGIRESFESFIVEDDLDLFSNTRNRLLKSYKPNNDWTHIKITPPGHPTTHFECRESILKQNKAGEPEILVGSLKKISKSNNTTEQKLRELIATKDKFFSIIAHDLINPFHNIIGFIELLTANLDDFSKEYTLEILGQVYGSANQAFGLLQNLLEWSRSQTGRIKFKPRKINVGDLAEETIELLFPLAQNKNIDLFSLINKPIYVKADENMVKTILRNLLSNAIKFTNTKGKVSIHAFNRKDMVEFMVTDTGIGIQQKNLKKLFNINENFSTPGTSEEKGTGLGLILCKEFVEHNKGTIWVESIQGKGSKFKFTLPVG